MRARRSEALEELLQALAASGAVTAAAAVISSPGRAAVSATTLPSSGGSSRLLFDAASLTKPFTATLALQLHRSGELDLGMPIGEAWADCEASLARRPLADLLRHRSGLRAWAPLYRRCRGRAGVERLLRSGALLGATGVCYSDLGYILWGFVAEAVTGRSLQALFEERLREDLALDPLRVRPRSAAGVVPCHCDNSREVELARDQGVRVAALDAPEIGEPQDGNARFLGGLAGHAGLFVGLDTVVGLGRLWLSSLEGRGPLPAALVGAGLQGRGEYAQGWARRRVRGSAGPALSPGSFGHVGFTGTSLWIDPLRRRVMVLLAHRSSPGVDLNSARRRFHGLAVADC